LYALFGDVIWPAKILGIVCLACSGLIVAACARRLLPNSAWLPLLAGLIAATSPPLVWGCLSGLEVPLYLFVVCVGLYCYLSQRWIWAAVCWSVGIWLRPDGVFLAALAVSCPGASRDTRIRAAFVIVACFCAYVAFNLAVGGSFFPTSVGVKASFGGNFAARAWNSVAQWLWLWGLSIHAGRYGPHMVLTLSLMAVGAVLLMRKSPALAIYPMAFPIVFGLFGPGGGQHGRYFIAVVPFGVLLAIVGLSSAMARLPERQLRTWISGAIVAAVLLWQGVACRLVGIAYGWNVQNINGMHRFLAEEVVRRLPQGAPVAVNDVGAIGYFGQHDVLDLAGLMSPVRSLPENLAMYHPPYMIIFPEWFQQYMSVDPETRQGVFHDADSTGMYSAILGVRLRNNTIASRNTMVVFKRYPVGSPAVASPELVVH